MSDKHEFKAEVQEVLNLVIHSLYSHREIFLRELISNASDAIDKRRVAALTEATLAEGQGGPRIRLELNTEERQLTVADNGIGMNHEDLIANLGTIARSGTRKFLEELKEKKQNASEVPELIGQFGVGFYASFMVADRIEVRTRKAGEDTGFLWSSAGDGSFEIVEESDLDVGTRVTLMLKEKEEAQAGEEPNTDFCDGFALQGLVKKYSDFVEYPVQISAEHFEGQDGEEAEDGTKVIVLNSRTPLWARPKNEITAEEHAEFYRHLSHDWNEPAKTIHFHAEGATEYSALLYLPSERPMDLFQPGGEKSKVSLYVKRVFIMGDCDELLPQYLRFAKGVVDSRDLPLNVSREILQQNRSVAQIQKRLTKKVLECLEGMLKDEREEYTKFWTAFGLVLKEGIVMGSDSSQQVAKLSLFDTTREGGPWTLDEICGRMSEDQKELYYLTGDDRDKLASSPHLESLLAKGHEVVLLTDHVDEWVVQSLPEYEGKTLRSAERGDLDESEPEKAEREKLDKDFEGLLSTLELALEDQVKSVRMSNRLKESPAVLVADDDGMTPQMERMMRASGREMPAQKRILELNPHHPVTNRLKNLQESDPSSEELKNYSQLLVGQALLAEGGSLPNPSEFAKLVCSLMVDD